MKKFFIFLLILSILAGLLYLGSQYFLSGKSTFQSIYLIPEDAVLIIESDAAFDAWDKIIHSDAWNKVRYVPYFSELNKEIQSLDSLLGRKEVFFKAINKRKILVSLHLDKSAKNQFLYVINIGRLTSIRKPEKIISSLLGKSYPLTQREFDGVVIYELLDQKSGEMYYFSFLQNKVVASTSYQLVEASILEMNKMTIGRDPEFINITKRVSGKGLFNVYVNYKYIPRYLQKTMGKTPKGITNLDKELTYSAFSFNIPSDGMITLEGYIGVDDSVSSFFSSALHAGSGGFKSASVIPARVASVVKISLDDPVSYYYKSLKSLSASEYESYRENLQKYEKKLKISVEDNILSWFGDEIVLLQTQPSNLGRNNEFAVIIKAKNKRAPENNLDYIEKQIKKNLPVKIKRVDYQGYSIHYLSLPGLLKALFGKILSKIEKPYYAIVGDYVIFSNHPQTLKNIIDDFVSGNILENSKAFSVFNREFSRKHSVFTYLDIPVLFTNLQGFVGANTWNKLNRNKPYITCFPQAGIQIDEKDGLLHFMIKTYYKESVDEYTLPSFNGDSFLSLFTSEEANDESTQSITDWADPEIIINDLDARKTEEFFDNGQLKYSMEIKDGFRQGLYREYYENGHIRVKGRYKNDLRTGSWKLYNEQGELIKEKEFNEGINSDSSQKDI